MVAGCGKKWIDEAEDRLGGVGGVDKGVPPFWVPAVDVEVETQISLLSFFFLSEASRQYKKKTLPGTEPSGQVFKWVLPRRYPLFAAVEIQKRQVPVRTRARGASLGAGWWVLGGTLVLKGPGREVDDRKWTE